MADIQAEGLRAASALLERMLGSERAPNGDQRESPPDDYAALIDAWTELTRRFIGALAENGPMGGMTVSLQSDGVAQRVRLVHEPAQPDDTGTDVWLHNGTTSEVGPLVFRCSDLSDSEGSVMAGAEVRFDPPEMEPLPSRSSRAVSVSLVATGAPRPGTYRGTIQAQGAPGLWLPLEVVVKPC